MRMRKMAAALLAGAAMLALPGVVSAQDARDLDQEQSSVRSFTGTVSGAEPVVFHVGVPAGTTMRIDVLSTSGLDPMVKVIDRADNEILAEDDDGGDELNARAVIRGGDAGRNLRIEVSSYSYEGMEVDEASGGSFTLQLTMLSASTQAATTLGWGAETSGFLAGEQTHEFAFQGEAGMLLDMRLEATEYDGGLDPYLELRDADGEVVAANDDSGGGLNARLRHVMEDDSVLTIVASAYGDSAGEYTLRVGPRREPLVQAPLQVIGIGDTATGRLGTGYETEGLDPESIDYQLSEDAIAAIRRGNGEVTIRMEAVNQEEVGGLDSYLELGFDTPLGFAVVQSDDDGAGNLNAMLPVDLSDIANSPDLLARLRIRAKAFAGSEGDYTLVINEGMEERVEYDYAIEAAAEEPIYD